MHIYSVRYIVSFLIAFSLAAAGEVEVPGGVPFTSADGRFSVELREIDKLMHFAITDHRSGHEDTSVVMPTVLLYLHWSEDSRSIVTVEHIANGSYARILHFADDSWVTTRIYPASGDTSDVMNATLVRMSMKDDEVIVDFAVSYSKHSGAPVRFELMSVKADLNTLTVLVANSKTVTAKEWAARFNASPEYLPPMGRKRAGSGNGVRSSGR